MRQAQPGIYTQPGNGSGPGQIIDYQTGKLVTTDNKAHVGDTITIYCNGLGAVTPQIETGTAAPTDGTLERTTNTVTVTIGAGGMAITEPAAFAGLTPGYPDLYQVNALVPAGVQSGDAVPIVLTVADQSSSATVTIAIE